MKKLILILPIILLGCSTKQPYKTITEQATKQITELKKELPKECKTESVLWKIDTIQTQINNIADTCDLQIENEKAKNTKWIIATIISIFITIFMFVLKKKNN